MIRKYRLLFLALFLVSCQTPSKNQSDSEFRQPAVAASSWPEGPIDDCIQSEYLFNFAKPISSECTLNYVHIFPSDIDSLQMIDRGQTKIASFNLFHMGDNQVPLKDFRRMAKIMNQWDVVAGLELMPLPNEPALANKLIFHALQEKDKESVQTLFKNQPAQLPGHIRMLIELQKLDSSWALIMQPQAEGEGTSGEMVGFFYRASVARLKEWNYCPDEGLRDVRGHFTAKNLACVVQVPEKKRELMSRSAFAAFFQIGKFDFIALGSHTRFRPAKKQDLPAQSQDLCEGQDSKTPCRFPDETVGRFYEVKAVLEKVDEIKTKSNDQDVIYMGDFNLEYAKKTLSHWKAALSPVEGFQVYQDQPSTLGTKSAVLKSNYDHIIMDSHLTKECLTASIKPFDFTQGSVTSSDPLLKDLGKLLTSEGQNEVMEYKTQELAKTVKFQNPKSQQVPFRNLSDDEMKVAQANMQEDLAAAVALKHSHAFFSRFLSDHIPIEMVCQTSRPDDD